jgi:hypothetical protein
MQPQHRQKLIGILSTILRMKTGAAQREALALWCLRHAIFEGLEENQWRETIWPEVQERTGCEGWDAIMNGGKH